MSMCMCVCWQVVAAGTKLRQQVPQNIDRVGQVTYTAETTATPWGTIVAAPENDLVDVMAARRGAVRAGRGIDEEAVEAVPEETQAGYDEEGAFV
jgi:hypothetical protein